MTETAVGDMAAQQNERKKTDVFLSYSSLDRDRVELVAVALQKAGFNVWWDRNLLPGDSYEGSIEVALKEAKAVVVCWTPQSAASDWVRSEADDARVHGKLCPVMLEPCDLPKPFDRIHTEDLSGWRGNRDHHTFQELEEAVRARVEGRAAKAIPWRRKWITRGAFVSLIAMVGVAAANVSLIKDVFFPQETVTSADVEKIVAAALAQAAANGGVGLDDRGQENLRAALSSVLASADKEKAAARAALSQGRVEEAANSLADVARRQAEAAGGAVEAAAQSWREAGALYAASDTRQAVKAYEESRRLNPADPDTSNQLAHLYERQGKLTEAEALYTSILEGVGQADPLWKAKALGNLALMAEARGEWAEAADGFRAAMQIFEEQGDQLSVAKALINLGKLGQENGDLESAEAYSKRGLAASRALGLDQGEATALANLGYVAMAKNDFPAARDYFQQAGKKMDKLGMETEKGLIYVNMSRMLRIEGDLDEAEAMARKALAIAQSMDARMVEGGAYNHLGGIARERGLFEEAERYEQMAIRIFSDLGARKQLEQEYRAYASLAEDQGDLDAAVERYGMALEQARSLDAPTRQASIMVQIARVLGKAGRYDDATTYLQAADVLYKDSGDNVGIGDLLTVQGQVAFAQGEAQDAVNAFARAAEYFIAGGEPAIAAEVMIRIADVAFQAEDPAVAEDAVAEALRMMPEDAPVKMRTYALSLLAESRYMRRDDVGARAAAQDNVDFIMAQSGPNLAGMQAEALVMLARLERQTGGADAARAHYTRAAEVMRAAGGDLAFEAARIEAERDQ